LFVSKAARERFEAEQMGPLGLPLQHQGPVLSVAFSPDGKAALTGSSDKTARLWDVATGKPLGPSLPHPGAVVTVGFGPDGGTLLTGCEDNCIRIWKVPTPVGGGMEWIEPWTQAVTGMRLDPRGIVDRLESHEWLLLRERLGGRPF
jgi:WD40 repeat protein